MENVVAPDRPQVTLQPMRISRWIPKATNTLRIYNTYFFFRGNNGYSQTPQYVILIFPVFYSHISKKWPQQIFFIFFFLQISLALVSSFVRHITRIINSR
jgi:hypothetical protein